MFLENMVVMLSKYFLFIQALLSRAPFTPVAAATVRDTKTGFTA